MNWRTKRENRKVKGTLTETRKWNKIETSSTPCWSKRLRHMMSMTALMNKKLKERENVKSRKCKKERMTRTMNATLTQTPMRTVNMRWLRCTTTIKKVEKSRTMKQSRRMTVRAQKSTRMKETEFEKM
jgi:hypothetical protein